MNHKLDTKNQIFFYEQEFYVLSNFSAFRLKWFGLDFDTSEAAYHWCRFVTGMEDETPDQEEQASNVAASIYMAKSAHEAFKIAQDNKDLQRKDWNYVKVDTMRNILRAKVNQHSYVMKKLLETGDRELIEDSWRDDFWGWGNKRNGQNMLGKLWMEVREEFKS